jgi:diamine N-acetyltransferase
MVRAGVSRKWMHARHADEPGPVTVSIRPASTADVDAILLLNQEVQQLHAAFEPTIFRADTSSDEINAYFAARLSAAGHEIRLAEIDGTPVGYIWFEVQDRPETPFQLSGKRIYIHHLSVRKTARRSGVGSALLERVQAEALATGITSIALDTWAANATALHFFEARGFSPFNLVLRKRLS